MTQNAADDYLSPYHQAHDDHGSDFKVTLWASERSQRLRFRVMTEMVFMLGKRVLDAGCSRGDFAAYMLRKDIAYESFVGVDAVEPVVAFAGSRGLAGTTFVTGDFVSDPSYLAIDRPQVIAISGTLNTMDDDTAIGLLEQAWAATSETLVFNFLSDRASDEAPKQTGPARRLPTLKLMDWALAQTPSVRMRQDYFRFGHDATIVMRKG
jgi:SAM-dependent methyltransferase